MKRRTFLRSAAAAAVATSIPGERAYGAFYRAVQQVPSGVDAVRGDGSQVTLGRAEIREFADVLRGRLLMAGDNGYDDARRILNPSFDKRPALIAQVTGATDVSAAVRFAHEHDLLVAVKCGGHSSSGKSTCDGGLLIDLSPFRSVRVDPLARRARVTGGSLLGLLDHEAMSHGLVTPMGTVSHTGVGGLTTGGGFGRVARRFGLALDNVTAVDVVTADGELRHANSTLNQDLYWGVRGGGGNFGVVTSFEFRLHPMEREVLSGQIVYPLSKAREVLTLYGQYGPEAPNELYLGAFLTVPPGGADGVCGFGFCYSGPMNHAEHVLAPLRGLGTPLADDARAMDYVAVQRSGDVDDPRALAGYMTSGFISELGDDLATAIAEGFQGDPNRVTQLFFQPSGGAINTVASGATAFPHRRAFANMLAAAGWAFGSDPEPHMAHTRQYWRTLEPFTGGFYSNDYDPGDDGSNFGPNHRRLVQLKNRYDPTNLFRLNANVLPTV